jgi:hypothetical protein
MGIIALARHAHQDLHKLLGKERLSHRDRMIANGLALELMEAEVAPSEMMLEALAGAPTRFRIGD